VGEFIGKIEAAYRGQIGAWQVRAKVIIYINKVRGDCMPSHAQL